MQKQKQEYFNFINSLNSESTKKIYSHCLEEFLKHSKLDLHKFLKLPEQKMTNIIIEYLVEKESFKTFQERHFCHTKTCM